MSNRQRAAQSRTRRARPEPPLPPNRWLRWLIPLVAAAGIVLIVGIGVASLSSAPPPVGPSGSSSAAAEAIPCDPIEHLTYHVHSHLAILVDGQPLPIPDNVGNGASCLYWLHTHTADGIIHVEAPTERVFTLGQFFDVWGQPLTPQRVATATVPPGAQVAVFVDGQPYEGDPRDIRLVDHRAIEIQVAASPSQPQPYTFPPGY